MDKREALEIYLKVHRECLLHKDCSNCPFWEQYKRINVCTLSQFDNVKIAVGVEAKLKRISEAPEQKPLVARENVKATTTLYVKSPLSAEEFEKQLKGLLPKQIALEPLNLPKEDRAIKMPESSKPDNVNRPKHYCKGGVESIAFVKAAVSNLSGFEAVCVANIIKYMWRYKEKNGLEDVMKAAKYLEWLQEEVGKNANKA